MTVDQTLAQLSNVLIYSAMAVYTAALAAFAVDLSGRGRSAAAQRPERELVAAGVLVATRAHRATAPVGTRTAGGAGTDVPTERRAAAGIAVSLTWLAFLVHLGGVVSRGWSVHRAPWGNMYEFSISGALVVTGVYLVLLLSLDLRYLGTFVVGPVLLTLGLAVTVFYTQASQLVPALDSYWLIIHVTVAFVAAALMTIGFSLTLLQLVQHAREDARAAGRSPRGAFMDLLPNAQTLEATAYRLHAVAFPLWTFTVIAGAIWAERAWGRYWNWDPKEVWSFVIWVAYAGYLHARATRGWDGRRAAWLAVAAYGCLLFNWFVVNTVFVGLHSYA